MHPALHAIKYRQITAFFTLFSFFFLFLGNTALATTRFNQAGQPDTLSPKFRLKPVVSMDNKATWIGGEHTAMFGLKIGVEQYPYRFGVGYCGLFRTIVVPNLAQNPHTNLDINFGYWNLWLDRLWFRDKHWEVKTAFQLGYGRLYIAQTNAINDVLLSQQVKNVGLMEISQDFHYKICDWFAVGAAAGYRFMLNDDDLIQQNVQAPMYALRLKVFPIELIQAIGRKRKK